MRAHLHCVKILLVLLTLGLFAHSAVAQGYYDYSPRARQTYEAIMALRLDEAKAGLHALRQAEPDNLVRLHLANYLDFFTLYIGEDPEVFSRRKPMREARLRRLAREGDPKSPWHRYIQADIRLHWALARLKFGEYLGAFTDVSKAYKLLLANQDAFPEFMPNYKDLGILHAMVGTIPDTYRWGLKLLGGLDGTIEQGRRELEQVMVYQRGKDFLFANESTALYAYLLLHLDNAGEEAWSVVKQAGFLPEDNLLHCFVLANVAMRTNRNEEALHVLENRPLGPGFMPFHYLDLMLGLARLRNLDPEAEAPLLRYARGFEGQNFIKESWQKLAWNALVHGDEEGYHRYMEACRTHGNVIVDGDQAAQREAESEDAMPDPALLRARLLFDGGYYEQARDALAGKTEADFPPGARRHEFLYRQGRILHGLEQYAQAINAYQRTVQLGWDAPEFYACNAALQIALIYEHLQMPELATRFFQTALDIYPEEYRSGMHQRAKAGLARLRAVNP